LIGISYNYTGFFLPLKQPRSNSKATIVYYQGVVKRLRMITSVSLVIGIIAIAIGAIALINSFNTKTIYITQNAPVTNVESQTLAGINTPINSTQLSIINNAPNSYFGQAVKILLNGSINNPIFTGSTKVQPFKENGKVSVVYLGSITCIFCGENRWAMALALSRFGSFSTLYTGYSSLGDGDVPTLYWTHDTVNSSADDLGDYYSSPYINFIAIEDTHNITGGFVLNSLTQIQQNIARTNNSLYISAYQYLLNLTANKSTAFQGTPYTVWGSRLFSGADAEDFGNSTPTGSVLPLSGMTHAQVFQELSNPNDGFGWTEYAAADIYVAAICNSINNTATICANSTMQSLETQIE
jgi:hypothetical protein